MELETLEGGTQEGIDEVLIAACNERSLAGIAAGIVKDGRVAYAKGFGIADAERGVPIAADTSFRIGSISKTFTAIGLMQLHEQERFKLDEPVNNYLKAYKVAQPSASPPVTFRHLLTHTSGIGELRRLSDLLRPTLGLACKRETSDPARPLRPNPQGGGPAGHQMGICEPRLRDAGPASRGHQRPTVCRIYARSRFCAARNGAHGLPAQRTRTSDDGAGLSNAPARVRPIPYREIIPGPAGSVFSSVNEMVKYLAALLASGATDTGQILMPGTLATMMTPHYQLDSRLAAVGLAFMIDRADGTQIVGHDGGWPGFTSSMRLAPDRGVGVVVFTNTTTLPLDALARALIRHALDAGEPARAKPILEQPTLWNELCGTYRPDCGFNTNLRLWMLGGALRVFAKRGHLMIGGRLLFGPVRRGLRAYAADPSDPLLFCAELGGIRVMVLFRRNSVGRVDSMSVAAGAGAFASLKKK